MSKNPRNESRINQDEKEWENDSDGSARSVVCMQADRTRHCSSLICPLLSKPLPQPHRLSMLPGLLCFRLLSRMGRFPPLPLRRRAALSFRILTGISISP